MDFLMKKIIIIIALGLSLGGCYAYPPGTYGTAPVYVPYRPPPPIYFAPAWRYGYGCCYRRYW